MFHDIFMCVAARAAYIVMSESSLREPAVLTGLLHGIFMCVAARSAYMLCRTSSRASLRELRTCYVGNSTPRACCLDGPASRHLHVRRCASCVHVMSEIALRERAVLTGLLHGIFMCVAARSAYMLCRTSSRASLRELRTCYVGKSDTIV